MFPFYVALWLSVTRRVFSVSVAGEWIPRSLDVYLMGNLAYVPAPSKGCRPSTLRDG